MRIVVGEERWFIKSFFVSRRHLRTSKKKEATEENERQNSTVLSLIPKLTSQSRGEPKKGFKLKGLTEGLFPIPPPRRPWPRSGKNLSGSLGLKEGRGPPTRRRTSSSERTTPTLTQVPRGRGGARDAGPGSDVDPGARALGSLGAADARPSALGPPQARRLGHIRLVGTLPFSADRVGTRSQVYTRRCSAHNFWTGIYESRCERQIDSLLVN